MNTREANSPAVRISAQNHQLFIDLVIAAKFAAISSRDIPSIVSESKYSRFGVLPRLDADIGGLTAFFIL